MDSRLDQAALDERAATGRVVTDEAIRVNARVLEAELDWFMRVVDTRFRIHFQRETEEVDDVHLVAPPDLRDSASQYAQFICHYDFSFAPRLAVVLSLVRHLRPRALDVFFTKNETFDRRFTEFGGHGTGSDGDFEPTGETLAFLLGGDNLETRFVLQGLLGPESVLMTHNILNLESNRPGEPLLRAPLRLSEECLSYFTTGRPRRPVFGAHFPAQRIDTQLEWQDVVLHPGTREQVREIMTWIEHGDTLMRDWGMAAKLRPGHRSLFYGPPGTGKTMTACLPGKSTGRDVSKIDLSLVVSKYIGETEKNLARVFDQAQSKSWILFFDEADALFGKRSQTKDAHDRYANQETSFLLQRIESFDGIAILASNLRENLDDAFTRRFETIAYFPLPRSEERASLWKNGFSPSAALDPSLDLSRIAEDYALSGGSIMNVVRYVSLRALEDGGRPIGTDDVLRGIRREYAKEGREG